MQKLPLFKLGKRYAVAGKAVTCCELTQYSGLLRDVQRVVLVTDDKPEKRYSAVRYSDGSVMRLVAH